MPQQPECTVIEPLVFERVSVTVNGDTVQTALFDARYDFGARVFHGYALIDGTVQCGVCALDPQQAAVAISHWVHGWITRAQRTALFHLACDVKRPNVIVEIGSWKGKSTAILGWGSKAGDKAQVWAIDPHEATPSYWIIHTKGRTGSSYTQFMANMEAGGLLDVVRPLRQSSEMGTALVREPVGLLFVDGDHDYAALDVALWVDRVIPGGVVALHDTNVTHVQTAMALIEESGAFGPVEHVDSMAVYRRLNA